jgi:hypothetical protein
MGSYEVRCTFIDGQVRAMKSKGLIDSKVLALLPATVLPMVEAPYSQTWWDGTLSEILPSAVATVHGERMVEEVSFLSIRDKIGPMLTPLTSVIGSIFGLKPDTLFNRVADLAGGSIRGVAPSWRSTGSTTGVITFVYPVTISKVVGALWRGAARYIFELCRVDGTVTETRLEGTTVHLHCSWKTKGERTAGPGNLR